MYLFGKIAPAKKDVFNAFKYCDYQDLKVVIIGQEPYCDGKIDPRTYQIEKYRASGFAFGNHEDTLQLSPELHHIIIELEDDLDLPIAAQLDVTLKGWAEQGILLLNSALTVEERNPESHTDLWRGFARLVIKHINEAKPGTIFVLWGEHAQSYKQYIGEDMWVFEAPHPSSKDFLGCKHFSKVNANLHIQGKSEIKWI